MTGAVLEALNEYVETNKKVFSTDRSQTVGASEIGQCERKIAAFKLEGTGGSEIMRDPDYKDSWGARERGNLIENHLMVPAIKAKYGELAQLTGQEQHSFVSDFLSCTPDCLIDDEPPFLIEFKSIDLKHRENREVYDSTIGKIDEKTLL